MGESKAIELVGEQRGFIHVAALTPLRPAKLQPHCDTLRPTLQAGEAQQKPRFDLINCSYDGLTVKMIVVVVRKGQRHFAPHYKQKGFSEREY